MNCLLAFRLREFFNTFQFFLFDETGVTQALSIQVSQFFENALTHCRDASYNFLLHFRILDDKCCLLLFSSFNGTSNRQFMLAYSKHQLNNGFRLTILNYFLQPCPAVFSYKWLPIECNIDSLKEGRFSSFVLPINQHTSTFWERYVDCGQTLEIFCMQVFQYNHLPDLSSYKFIVT